MRQALNNAQATHAGFGGNDRKGILVPRIFGNMSVVFKTSHNVYDAPLVKRTSDVMPTRLYTPTRPSLKAAESLKTMSCGEDWNLVAGAPLSVAPVRTATRASL